MSATIRIESTRRDRSWRLARRNPALRRRGRTVIPEPLHPLEERRLLSQTFTVVDAVNDGSTGSLNWAIGQVNADTTDSSSSPDVIAFDIPGTGPFTMQAPGFTGVANPVIIDGYSQPGSSPNTLAQGDNANIQIVLTNGPAGMGLLISGGYSTVEGLAINDCTTDIELNGITYSPFPTQTTYGGDTVTGCFLGTDVTGEQVVSPSGGTGVEVDDVSNNTIGGTAPADRNVISNGTSGFLDYGIWVTGSSSGDNLIEGNDIGTDATGTMSLGNIQGISFYQFGTGNTVGGTTPGAGNIISGSLGAGVIISGSGTGLLVEGNFIGTDVTGTVALPNGTEDANNPGSNIAPGVDIETSGNTVGGSTPGAGNLISGNVNDGIDITNGVSGFPSGGQDNLIEGNLIGTDASGTKSLPNTHEGIGLSSGAQFNTIGGSTAGAGNVISGNSSYGILLSGNGDNLVQGNDIGTDIDGAQAIANYRGVEIQSSGNTIGGIGTGSGNVISGNAWGGVTAESSANDNVFQGNYIGTDATGSLSVPNGFLSYYYVGGINLFSSGNTIGGTAAGAGNVISGNGSDGVDIIGASGNLLQGNLIGVGANGTEPLGNGAGGISAFYGASNNTIGGVAIVAGNTIANNQTRPGVNIGASNYDNCPGNEILSNSIYNNGRLGIDLGFNGVNQNMPGGPFQGPNDLQNYPVLTQALTYPSFSAVAITGTLNSDPNTAFTLQFFASPTADASGYGQGQTLIGTITVTTDTSGNASFAATFTSVVVPVGDAISATATDPSGDTSEFAQDVTAVLGGSPLQAVNDTYNTDLNTTLTVAAPGVQANDFSVLGGSFSSVLVSPTSHGTVTLNANGSFTYTPKTGYTGTDSFTYDDVADGTTSNVATVTISVNPKTLYVTNTSDSGPGSLRQALLTAAASNSSGADAIDFKLTGTGPFVITPASPLPVVSHPTVINGYSQAGAHTNSLSIGDNAVIEVQIDGSASGGADGLVLSGGDSTVEGLSITRFDDAILITGAGGDTITGNFLGTTPAGNAQGYGNQVGIEVQTSGNTLGGAKPAPRNVISGNNSQGVLLHEGASGNTVAGNYIGVGLTGESGLGNNGGGVVLYDAPANTIGGSATVDGNVISGNGNDGVLVSSQYGGPGSLSTVIQGNIIGLDAEGIVALGNSNNGVEVDYGSGTLIGGPKLTEGNVISGNQAGVFLQNSAAGVAIEGNKIGTDARGYKAIGNQFDGVLLSGTHNTVGGTASADANIISGNGRDGVSDGVYSGTVGNNTIEGNLIGTDSTGAVALGNNHDGIELATIGDVVGGTTAATRNVISANGQFGLVLENNATGILVEGNFIGTDKTGTQPLGNGSDGVHIQDNASVNTIGGTAAKDGNTIAFNGGTGVSVNDSAVSNAILTNAIFSNGNQGIVLSGNGNDLQVAPVLTSAVAGSSSTTVTGTLTAAPNTTYTLQFFSNPAPDPSGSGQGETFLLTKSVTTNSAGVASFSVTIKSAIAAGEVISAMATSPAENTSAFSNDATATSKTSATAVIVAGATAVSPPPVATDLVLGALTTSSIDQEEAVLTELAVDQLQARGHRPKSGS